MYANARPFTPDNCYRELQAGDIRALLALVEACEEFCDTIRDSDDPNEVTAQVIDLRAALARVGLADSHTEIGYDDQAL
jgi:hypothetical protein